MSGNNIPRSEFGGLYLVDYYKYRTGTLQHPRSIRNINKSISHKMKEALTITSRFFSLENQELDRQRTLPNYLIARSLIVERKVCTLLYFSRHGKLY